MASDEFGDVDKWIETLKECKQLTEADVKKTHGQS